MKLSLSILLFIFSSQNLLAYSPTLESLLRNGNNGGVGEKTVVAKMSIKKIVNKVEDSDEVKTENLVERPQINQETFLKILVSNYNDAKPRLLQLEYKNSSFKENSLARVKEFNFKNIHRITRSSEFTESKLFYGLMGSLLRNDGQLLLQLFKSLDIPVVYNSELIRQEKYSLLKRYRNYLSQVKNGEEGAVNPLKSDDEKRQEKINKVLEQSFLRKDDLVVREKYEGRFNWIVRSNGLFVRFDKDNRLKELSITTDLGRVSVYCGKFVSYSSSLEFPEYILFKDFQGQEYEIKMNSLSLITDGPKNFEKRLRKYNKSARANNFSSDVQNPSFIP